MMLEVVSGGPQTTVQDLGRPGYLHTGMPPSGAFDSFSLRVANLLVGNNPGGRYLVGRDPGDAGAPHHPVATGRRDGHADDRPAITIEPRTEDRQVVGRVVDRGGPDLPEAEAARGGHQLGKPGAITAERVLFSR